MPLVRLAVAFAVLGPQLVFAQGADPSLGRNVAASCSACHGTGGVSVGVVPSLAGSPRDGIVAKMQEFKAGRRPGTIMPQLAKGYTDEQIDAAAAWFAAQPVPSK